MIMEYFDYTQADAENDGIGYPISRYSKKVVINNITVGAIIFQDTNLKIEQSIIDNSDSDDSKLYYKSLNSANSIYLRKIIFSEEYLYSGALENLFDYITLEVIPRDFLIWCNDTSLLRKYIVQIGGFNPPLYELSNSNILLFSINK